MDYYVRFADRNGLLTGDDGAQWFALSDLGLGFTNSVTVGSTTNVGRVDPRPGHGPGRRHPAGAMPRTIPVDRGQRTGTPLRSGHRRLEAAAGPEGSRTRPP